MPQTLSQTQSQRVEQQLRLSQQQLQLVKLLEMPIAEFEQQVKKELMENPALEEGTPLNDSKEDVVDSADEFDANDTGVDPYSDSESDDYEHISDYSADDLPVYSSGGSDERYGKSPVVDGGSFIEYLESQIMNYDLSDDEEKILKYLIGSLDNRGFIDRPIETLTDELAFKEYLYVTNQDVEKVLHVLQSFDPVGIGARSTQECLLLQIDRQLKNPESSLPEYKQKMLRLERDIISNHYDLFLNKNKERLKNKLGLSALQINALFDDIKKLNVNPGFALNEAAGERVQTQIPDFIVETDPEGGIQMRLSNGEVPRLHVSREYMNQLKTFLHAKEKMTRSEKEGMAYTRQKIEAAQMFIESVKQRRRTLYETMNAIIDLQRTFFLTKDENDKVRLVLEDVAKRTGFDVSTISRVCNSKHALLDGRIYPLSDFFKLTRKNAEGQEIDGRQVKMLLKEIVENEDKQHPYSDDKIVELLKRRGLMLARRTVAKYRMELGIPSVNGRHG
ncbi:MAG: RNA polymerase factor sigma-54 [Bacteroidaceae bacterium]|nr:RNA polymerase factor sigma-54 [Bacteroidaceae bacterium]